MSANAAVQIIPQQRVSLVEKFAAKYSVEPDKLLTTLKATAFKQRDDGPISNEQMAALLIVADQYGLNPFTKEIFAFPDKQNGIVPVVGVDGWSRIINGNPQFDGMDFQQDDESCTCRIYRKDRAHPIAVTEYMAECWRDMGPWKSHPKRMLRHKAMIQCARIAFGFGGIYDQDEAEHIVERDMGSAEVVHDTTPKDTGPKPYPAEAFAKNLPAWTKLIVTGKKTAADIIKTVSSKAVLSDEQKKKIEAVKKADAPAGVTYAQVADKLAAAKDYDEVDAAADLIGEVADPAQRTELSGIYHQRKEKLSQ